ncbi:uncharacterized protein LOC113359124 [Papaver somniferum]|uniref:uncharacterized protein LOC113359124 n=1 Tax=Papaver somniferum TaxID=3469 RepID=UPI000E6FA4FF|nr:uncharacterized protein LOC113359124 [Papaver somniferum]
MFRNEVETTEHLLFHFPYAKTVWNSSPNPVTLNLDTSITIVDLCKKWMTNPRTDISIELLLTKMWFIWKERCDKIFEDKTKNANILALEIQRHVEFWSTRKRKTTKSKQVQKNKLNPKWKAPNIDTLKINVDASWISEVLPSTCAFILRNYTRDCERGRAGQAAGSDPQEAEPIGVLQAAIWAKERKIQNFSIEGDCESIFIYIHGKNSDISGRTKAYINEANRISHLCNNFLGFFFVPRLGNQVADILAKSVRPLNSTVEWGTSPPVCSRKQLLVDKSNIGNSPNPRLDGSTSFVTSTLSES